MRVPALLAATLFSVTSARILKVSSPVPQTPHTRPLFSTDSTACRRERSRPRASDSSLLPPVRRLQDEIKQLPGWNEALPSRHYSGYLEVPGDHAADGRYTGNKYYHYWCAQEQHAFN